MANKKVKTESKSSNKKNKKDENIEISVSNNIEISGIDTNETIANVDVNDNLPEWVGDNQTIDSIDNTSDVDDTKITDTVEDEVETEVSTEDGTNVDSHEIEIDEEIKNKSKKIKKSYKDYYGHDHMGLIYSY